mmetsp:Transcript_2487/g.7507  ORF Transcript_2487/g.7507 Transcript_2487/m.7507 type:complete len:201 (+) Transcript_2487:368-970(+)
MLNIAAPCTNSSSMSFRCVSRKLGRKLAPGVGTGLRPSYLTAKLSAMLFNANSPAASFAATTLSHCNAILVCNADRASSTSCAAWRCDTLASNTASIPAWCVSCKPGRYLQAAVIVGSRPSYLAAKLSTSGARTPSYTTLRRTLGTASREFLYAASKTARNNSASCVPFTGPPPMRSGFSAPSSKACRNAPKLESNSSGW